jgi:uncharacterized phage protein gp47/JayE
MSGVESTGFVTRTTAEIQAELATAVKGALGAEMNTEADSVTGILLGILADKYGEHWEVMQAIYSARDPDAAAAAALDAVCSLTGTRRDAATSSNVTVTVTCTGVVNVSVGNFIVSVDGNPDARFANAEAIVAGGAGDVDVLFEAEEAGAVVANAGTLTVIETPVSGISSVTNALDANTGNEIETDTALRTKRLVELEAVGAGTFDTVKAKLAQTEGVEHSTLYANASGNTDSNGIPGHYMWPIVYGSPMPDGDDVAQVLWASKPAGIGVHGSSSGTATDAEGNSQTVSYDEATVIAIHAAITVDTDADLYPADGDDQIKAAILAAREAFIAAQGGQGIGLDVYSEPLKAAAFEVAGVIDITAWTIDTVDPPVASSNISIGVDEFAYFDTANIDVTS